MRYITLLLVFMAQVSTLPALAQPLRYAEDRRPAIVHPAYTSTMAEARINELVFESLFTDNYELESVPLLAEKIDLAQDGMSATITLRNKITWHDGEPFTAKDVVFTIEALQNPSSASTEAGRVAWIKSAIVLTPNQVFLAFVKPEAFPQDKLHFKILPKHEFSSTSLKRTDAFRNQPMGTGPYQVNSTPSDPSITLTKYRKYHRKTRIDEFILREISDKNYQAKLLVYESIEALVRVLPRDIATLQANRTTELYPYQTNSWWYLGFNQTNLLLMDRRVRKAISLLIDGQALLDPIGTGDLVSGPFVRSSPYYNHQVKPTQVDVEGAMALFAEAGYARSGGYLTRQGRPLKLRLMVLQNLEAAQEVVINLQSQLAKHGIQIEPVFLSAAAWKQTIWDNRAFDLVLSQWSFDRNEDIYPQFHSQGNRNIVGYASETVDAWLKEARSTTDPVHKKALLRKAHKAIAADYPMRFLFTLDSYSAMSTRVRNVVIHPFTFFTWANEWHFR